MGRRVLGGLTCAPAPWVQPPQVQLQCRWCICAPPPQLAQRCLCSPPTPAYAGQGSSGRCCFLCRPRCPHHRPPPGLLRPRCAGLPAAAATGGPLSNAVHCKVVLMPQLAAGQPHWRDHEVPDPGQRCVAHHGRGRGAHGRRQDAALLWQRLWPRHCICGHR